MSVSVLLKDAQIRTIIVAISVHPSIGIYFCLKEKNVASYSIVSVFVGFRIKYCRVCSCGVKAFFC